MCGIQVMSWFALLSLKYLLKYLTFLCVSYVQQFKWKHLVMNVLCMVM